MASLFLSYSHRDEELRAQLETHLAALRRQGFISVWHDRRIMAGEDFANAIEDHLAEADIVLLLVSPDFIASDYCYEKEMRTALARHNERECVVIPVILRPCDWHEMPFGKLLATPTDGRPITLWPNRDEAFLDVVKAIKGALVKRNEPRTPARASATPARQASSPAVAQPRSSNLRVTKRFTEKDADNFLHESFDYMQRYFGASLAELHGRNPEIEGRLRQVNANCFTVVAYRDEKALARCYVRLGDRHGSEQEILFSYNEAAELDSYNESLAVAHDSQKLYLKPLGMGMRRRSGDRDDDKLTMEGASEYYWELFIEPLQQD
jgi:hypothetical protein